LVSNKKISKDSTYKLEEGANYDPHLKLEWEVEEADD